MQRMTLTAALDHDWLALPSSQHSEGPAYQLGGDSMYSIQDFDHFSDEESVSFSAGEWSRPMTASGTNLESGMGLADLRGASVESDDSYSQKVEDFHLHSSPGRKAKNAKSLPHPLSLSMANPPSPPLTEERIQVEDPDLGEGQGQEENGDVQDTGTKEGNVNNVANSPSPRNIQLESRGETPGTATKRKALEIDLFASGSLSPPPPDDVELPSPVNAGHKPSTPKNKESSANEAPSSRRTTRSTVKPTATGTPITRGRKSMRLT
jgi:hypothetical protein